MLRNVLASGFHLGVEARGDSTAVSLSGIALFGISRYDVAAGTHYEAPDVGEPIDCASGRVRPAESLTQFADAPPQDGFFDARARYLGAFRDAEDGWLDGWTRDPGLPD